MGDFLTAEHTGKDFRGFDTGGAEEDGLSLQVALLDEVDDGLEFFALGLVDLVVEIFPRDGAVRWHDEDLELVDVVEFGGFGLGGAGHASELLVEAEVWVSPSIVTPSFASTA